MNQARKRTGTKKVLSMILVLVMLLSLLSMAAFTLPTAASSDSAASNDDSFYRIVHLDCGRKYFTKDWIIALLNEMSADGYNQLQLAFGNDGLRFLLDDMSFTANGTTYLHETVVSNVEAGNKLQNSSGDASWLTQTEMDEIIATAQTLGIEIVPLLNLPGHANAILDIVNNNMYNAKIYGTVSQNTLDVTNDAACNFGYEIFKKYVDYFSSKGCKYFNFGADEYGNDVGENPHFDVLNGTGYQKLSAFINRLAAYIGTKNMTPRTFNDALYYNGWDMQTGTNTAIQKIQCCYWSSGWGSYPVAAADTIDGKDHAMINTNGEYYYVLGKNDNFDNGYSYASGFDNSAFAGNKKISNPVGSMFCIWCDFPKTEDEQTVAQKVRLPMRAMALRMEDQSIDNMDESVVTNGFNADGSPNAGSTVTPDTNTSTKDIYVAVNGTATVTVPGKYDGTYTTDDTSIATVTTNTTTPKKLKAVTSIESGHQYLIVNKGTSKALTYTSASTTNSWGWPVNGLSLTGDCSVNNTTDLWTITSASAETNQYTVKSADGTNLSIGNRTASLGESSVNCKLTYSDKGAYWTIDSDDGYHLSEYKNTVAAGYGYGDDANQWLIYEITGGETTTALTFHGVAEGITSVQIGGVTYTIHVTAEDLSKVTPLTIEYWITNQKVTADGATIKQIKATDPSVNSESGAKFSDLVPATGSQGGKENVLWKGTRLTSSNKQTTDGGNDQTRAGNDFTYIRYWNQKWSFSVDGKSWTDFNNDDQVVAYYLQKTDVTSEITTNVVDWGQPYSEWKAGGGDNGWFWNGYVANGSKYVFLDFAVVYEDNTQNPSSFPTDKTLFYHFDGCSETNPRVLGAISFTENSDYEIWKVTVTDGTSTGYSSYSTFAPTYDNTTETTVWDESMGGIPQIDQLKYTANRSGKLVRVYVRAKVTEDSLTVNYFDENNTSLPFYSYNIAVASGTTFNDGFAYSDGALINNTVTNIKGVTQKVNWKLEEMSEIGAQYRFGNYTFTSATKETGDKVVNLYYHFNAAKTFVVDFGLPLHIAMTDISPKLNKANVEGVTVGNSLYATVRANNDFSIDYILNETIDGSDRITVTYTGTKTSGESDSATYNLTIIPATSVYYEDSFATFTDGTGKANAATWTTVKDGTATKATTTQALTELGKMSADDVYGHDAAYADSTKLSMGSAHKVTVNANMVKDWTDGSAWPTATFTFKGTGFDIISLTDNNSSEIFVDVYAGKEATGTLVKQLTVNNYYGYKQDENGKWVVDTESSNALYQIPVMKVSGLDYGEYTAVIRVAYSKFFDTAKKNQYSFWLDAIRVYDPMGKDNDTYKQDNEGYPQYIKLRDALVDNTAKKDGALFIDGGSTAEISVYENYGPNNEVYLANGQAITFTVPKNAKIASIQIGAKAPDGRTAQMVVNSGEAKEIQSATEMYYKIGTAGGSFTIANTGTGILSLTNLKITFTTSGQTVTLSPLSTDAQTAAVMSVRALFAAPEQTFEPEYFTAKWSRNVRKGGTATLTVKASADVKAITVNGVEITAYTTKSARSFWGAKETYHVFTYRVTNAATADYSICAVNADGVVSDPITAKLTVRPSIRDWWNGIFDKWKH